MTFVPAIISLVLFCCYCRQERLIDHGQARLLEKNQPEGYC